jgi:uncharacterized protein with FMN-binding domain
MRARTLALAVLSSLGVIGVGAGAGLGVTLLNNNEATSTTTAQGTDTSSSGDTVSGSGTSSSSDTSSADTGSTTDNSASSSTASSSAASSSSALKDGTYKGETVSTRYGDIQVQVTVSGGKITEATTLQTPSQDGRSIQINQTAVPTLNQEVVSEQSSNISQVSGATFTSEGYVQSLQSALDAAK